MLRKYPSSFPVNVECAACVGPVENTIRDTKLAIEPESIKTDILSAVTRVEILALDDAEAEEAKNKIKQALNAMGLLREETEQTNPELEPNASLSKPDSHASTSIWLNWLLGEKLPLWLRWLLGGIGVASGIAMMALMFFALPLGVMIGLGVFSAVASLVLGLPTIIRAAKKLRHGIFDMDTLYALGGTIAIVATIGHLFLPTWLPMMFDAGLFVFGFQHIGSAIKESINKNIPQAESFVERIKPTIKVEGVVPHVVLNKIKIGSIICVPSGTVIPIDGIILDDEAFLYETIINGNTMPAVYEKKRRASSGLRVANDNIKDFVRIQTTHTFEDSHLSHLETELKNAKLQTPHIVDFSKNVLRYFVPTIIVLAIILGIISFTISCFFPLAIPAVAIAIKCIATVLASACPCALGLIMPWTEKTGMAKAEKHQVLFKEPDKLQAASQIDTVLLDLNGTLTLGEPTVRSFITEQKYKKLLATIAALEKHSSHAFARAICDYSAKQQLEMDSTQLTDIKHTHNGISAIIDGKRLTIGNAQMLASIGIQVKNTDTSGIMVTYVALDNKLIGHFLLEDPLREGTHALFTSLHNMGMKVGILSGADEKVVAHYQKQLNADLIYANCTNKSAVIKKLQAEGKNVAMFGDGANDAIAMLTSNLGGAIKSSSSDELTMGMAGVVIDSPSLLPIVALFETAKQTATNIKQNLIFSLVANTLTIGLVAAIGISIAAGVLLSCSFILNPAFGAAAMILLIGLLAANVGRFSRQATPHYEEACKETARETATPSTATTTALNITMGSTLAPLTKAAVVSQIKAPEDSDKMMQVVDFYSEPKELEGDALSKKALLGMT